RRVLFRSLHLRFTANSLRLDRIRCSFCNFFSSLWKNIGFLYTVPSERTAKSFKPTYIQTVESVFGISCTLVSARIDTKYLPLELRLTVAFIIRPFTSRLLANLINPSLGSFILLPEMVIFPFVCFVV